jgi:hypothetical protein
MTKRLRAVEIIFLDWYDGLVTGAVRTVDAGWFYLKLHWWSHDQDQRVFLATPVSDDLMLAYVADTQDLLSGPSHQRHALHASDELTRITYELVARVGDWSADTSAILLADPYLESGWWVAPPETTAEECWVKIAQDINVP